MSFLLFRARRKTPPRLPLGFRGHRSDALKKHKFASCWRWNLCFLAERKVPGLRAGPRNERSEFWARSNTRAACDRPARFRQRRNGRRKPYKGRGCKRGRVPGRETPAAWPRTGQKSLPLARAVPKACAGAQSLPARRAAFKTARGVHGKSPLGRGRPFGFH